MDGRALRLYALSKLSKLISEGRYDDAGRALLNMGSLIDGEAAEEQVGEVLYDPRTYVMYADRIKSYVVPLRALERLSGGKHFIRVYTMTGKTIWTKAVDSFVVQPAITGFGEVLQLPLQWEAGKVDSASDAVLSVYFEVPGLFRVDFVPLTGEPSYYVKLIYRRFARFLESKIGQLYEKYHARPVVGYDSFAEPREGELLFFLPVNWAIGSSRYYAKAVIRLRYAGDVKFAGDIPVYAVRVGFDDPFGLKKGSFVSPYSYVVYYAKKMGWM